MAPPYGAGNGARRDGTLAGTDRRRTLIADGPAVVLVNPQLGENIGAAARAMANFGLADLRLVDPRDGWPNDAATANAAKATHVIEAARVFATLEDAVADLDFVLATTARQRGMLKPVRGPREAALDLRARYARKHRTGILFGRERWGLESGEILLADEIVTFPVNPAYASLNIAQAVLLIAYEWMAAAAAPLPIGQPDTRPATKRDMIGLYDHLERALDEAGYFFPESKRGRLVENVRVIFQKADLSEQEVHALRGMIAALERN